MYEDLIKKLRNRRVCIQSGGDLETDFPIMKEAADAIEKLSKPRWISVKERLPEPKFAREWYLVHLESGCIKTLAFEKSGTPNNLFKDGWHETASRITHWMPLPTPPKEET